MKRIILILIFCSIFCNHGCAYTAANEKRVANEYVSEHLQVDNQLASCDDKNSIPTTERYNDVEALQEKLDFLKEKFEESKQCWNAVLLAQSTNYTISVTVLGIILAVGIALIGLFNFGFIKRDLHRDVEDAKRDFEIEIGKQTESLREIVNIKMAENNKELMDTIDMLRKESANVIDALRTNSANAQQDLRKEFYQYAQNLIKETSDKNDASFKEFESEYSKKLIRANAANYNALGRIYEEAKSYDTAFLWFARGIMEYLRTDASDDWIGLQIKAVTRNIVNSERKNITDDDIAEVRKLISIIPDERFKSGKGELVKAFEEKISTKI